MKDHHIALLVVGGTLWAFGLWVTSTYDSHRDAASHRHAHESDCCDDQQHRSFLVLERQLEVRPGGRLLVDVHDADVQVTTGGGGTATVKVYASARDEEWGRSVVERMQFAIDTEGSDLFIEADDPHIEDREWSRNRGVGVEVRVTIPTRFDADIRSGDGDISLGDLEGRVNIHSSDGDLQLGTLKGPEIKLRTSDGDVYAAGLEAPAISLHTSDGDVEARRVTGALEAASGDGDITVRLQAARETRIRTGDGDVTVYVAGSLGFELDLRAEDIYLGSGFQLDGSRGSGYVRGPVNGGGPVLAVRTSDGTVRLRTGG
jgi:hypothetical protein